MPQVGWEPGPTAGGPGVPLGIRAFIWSISIAAVEVQENMDFGVVLVVPVCSRTFNTRGDDTAASSSSRPGPKETSRRVLQEDGLGGLVLHEAQITLPFRIEREDIEVDDVGRRVVDIGLRCTKGLEVACVGIPDLDI